MWNLELADNLLQLLVTAVVSGYALFIYRRSEQRSFAFLSGAQGGWALGLLFWILYLGLRHYTPPDLNPSDIAWTGAHLFYLSINRSLALPGERAYKPALAMMGPGLALLFAVCWFYWGPASDLLVNIVWGAGFGWISHVSLRSMLYSRKMGQRARAHYHGLVLAMLGFDELVLAAALFYTPQDYHRFNWYYVFDLLVTLMLALQPVALRQAIWPKGSTEEAA